MGCWRFLESEKFRIGEGKDDRGIVGVGRG